MIIGIYKITSPSNKIYIGQSINIYKRWNQYKLLDKSSIGPKLFNSFQKYGVENHQFEIIEESLVEDLDEKEVYWKQYYIDLIGWKKVIFCEVFDNGGGPKSQETKQKQSQTHQKILSEQLMVEKRKLICKLTSTIENRIQASNNTDWDKRNNNLRKPKIKYNSILQLSLDNKIIKEWKSTKEIANYFNSRPQNLNTCLRGIYKTYMGFKWEYS